MGNEEVTKELYGVFSDKDFHDARNKKEIVISQFNENNLTPVGYNFSFSKFILSINRKLLSPLKENGNEIYCEVEPNDTVLILTREAIWVDKNIMGTFHSKVGIVSQGFGHISTTLDPGWQGALLFSLNNPTKKKIKLIIAMKKGNEIEYRTFVTLVLHKMISSSTKDQDNRPNRYEILKDSVKELKNSDTYSQKLRQVIEDIADCGISENDKISKLDGLERKLAIKNFITNHEKLINTLDYSIDGSIKSDNRRRIKRKIGIYLKITAASLPIFALCILGIRNFENANILISLIATIYMPIYVFTCSCLFKNIE